MENKLASLEAQREYKGRREAQKRVFQRNQAVGLLLLAAAVLVYRLIHVPLGWILPPGWWRLW